jgi:hypothetical protein
MKITNQKGFSLLHVLPAILIILGIAAIGARVLTQSHASTGLTCSYTFPYSSLARGTTRNAQVSIYNGSGKAVTYATGTAQVNSASRVFFATSSGRIANGTRAYFSVPVSYPGRAGNQLVAFYGSYQFSGTGRYSLNCGSRYVNFQ